MKSGKMAVSQGLSDELICAICLETFNNPVILPCAHTFCRQCLINVHERSRFRSSFRRNNNNNNNNSNNSFSNTGTVTNTTTLSNSGTVRRNIAGVNTTNTMGTNSPAAPVAVSEILTCPHCRAEVHLGSGGIANLPRNTTIANIILSLEEEKKSRMPVVCEVCDEDPPRNASKICSDCYVTYCITCFRQLHPMRGSFKYHVIKETNQSAPLISRCTSPVLESRGSISGRCTPSLDGGTDADSGDEGGSSLKKDNLEQLRKQIKTKKKELNSAMKNVQAMMKITEDDTEERMREVRSACSQITECVGERETALLTIISQQRHETVRQCVTLTNEVKSQTDRLDLLEDQVNDISSVQTVYSSPDMGNDITSLQNKLLEIQTKSLISKSKHIQRHPRMADSTVCAHVQAMDFVKDSDLISPVFTAIDYTPVSKGPALVTVKWSQIHGATKYRLSANRKDHQGNDVRLAIELPPSSTSYQLGLPAVDTDYTLDVETSSHEGNHPPISKHIKTLPYVHCLKIRFNPTTCHKKAAVSLTKDELVHRKCKLATLHNACASTASPQRLETLEGVTSDEPLPVLPHVYWQHVIHFHVFGKLANSRLLCDIGISKQGSEDNFSPLCDNFNSYSTYLVRRNTKICLEFWNGTNRENISRSIPVLDLDNDNDKTIKLGFYYNALRKVFAVVSPANNTVLCRFNVKFASILPVYALYSSDQVFVMIRSAESQKLPQVLCKLMTDG